MKTTETITIALTCLGVLFSCVFDTKYSYCIKNCTNDTLMINYSRVDTLANWEFWFDQDSDYVLRYNPTREKKVPFYYAIANGRTLPGEINSIYPGVFCGNDTCYIYTIKWSVVKKYSIEEIRSKKMYERRIVLKQDFDKNLMYEYKRLKRHTGRLERKQE